MALRGGGNRLAVHYCVQTWARIHRVVQTSHQGGRASGPKGFPQ